jgi:hypothetical protein
MMSEARHKQVLESQTPTAKKVYAVVPISEPWSSKQICTELMRTGKSLDLPAVQGCLKTLRNAGLIAETADFHFQREPTRPKASHAVLLREYDDGPELDRIDSLSQLGSLMKPPLSVSPKVASLKPTIFDQMSSIAADINIMGVGLVAIAKKIEDLAIQVEENSELDPAIKAQLEQLAVLKVALKGLS